MARTRRGALQSLEGEQMKKGFARRAIAATVALGLGMTLAACSGGGSGGGSGSSSRADVQGPEGHRHLLERLDRRRPADDPHQARLGVQQQPQEHRGQAGRACSGRDISAKMPLAIKAGKGPDLTVAHGDDIATYAAQGLLVKSDAIVEGARLQGERLPARPVRARRLPGRAVRHPVERHAPRPVREQDVLQKAGISPTDIPADKTHVPGRPRRS